MASTQRHYPGCIPDSLRIVEQRRLWPTPTQIQVLSKITRTQGATRYDFKGSVLMTLSVFLFVAHSRGLLQRPLRSGTDSPHVPFAISIGQKLVSFGFINSFIFVTDSKTGNSHSVVIGRGFSQDRRRVRLVLGGNYSSALWSAISKLL